MVWGIPGNGTRPSPGSLLDRWINGRRPHPDTFICGVRVLDGEVPGEVARWRCRRSAVDPLVADGIVTLQHGPSVPLRIRLGSLRLDPVGAGARPTHVVVTGSTHPTGARLQISLDAGELHRLGIEA